MYRIIWSMPNGQSGCGECYLTLELGQAWLEYLTKKYPDMSHTLEECTCV